MEQLEHRLGLILSAIYILRQSRRTLHFMHCAMMGAAYTADR
ncbi:hypothetical protein [Faecalibacterium prausnitzii]|nr:hypothetical protein [Faecalibacterium prausnitzii]